MEQYEPAIPLVLLQADYKSSRVPKSVAMVLDEVADDTSIFVQLHGQVPFNPCQRFICDSVVEMNVVYHAFFFPQVSPWDAGSDLSLVIECGVFEASGVEACHINPRDERGSGLAFGHLAPRDCLIHGGAYSPANCQLRRLPGVDWHCFWAVAREPTSGKSCVSFHAAAGSEAAERELRAASRAIKSADELLKQPLPSAIKDAIQLVLGAQ